MKVTATGVDTTTGLKMFEIWREGLERALEDTDQPDVSFVLESERGRT